MIIGKGDLTCKVVIKNKGTTLQEFDFDINLHREDRYIFRDCKAKTASSYIVSNRTVEHFINEQGGSFSGYVRTVITYYVS